MAYKTCENCGSRVFNHGCVNCDEMDYISMQGAYDSREVVKGISSTPVLADSFLCALATEKRCEKQCFTCSEDQKCDERHTKNLR